MASVIPGSASLLSAVVAVVLSNWEKERVRDNQVYNILQTHRAAKLTRYEITQHYSAACRGNRYRKC